MRRKKKSKKCESFVILNDENRGWWHEPVRVLRQSMSSTSLERFSAGNSTSPHGFGAVNKKSIHARVL